MKTFRLILLLCLLPLATSAQILPVEKVFLSSDRLDYNEGDSILIEGKVMTGDTLTTPYSRYVYVELFNDKDSLICCQKLVCETNGDFTNRMHVDFGLKKGYYYLRAFTKLMQNFPGETYPVFPIRIGITDTPKETERKNDLFCKFFPEGGHLGIGEAQNIAVYLYNQDNLPVEAAYTIVTAEGDTIQRQKTTPGGWQTNSFTPQKGKVYYLIAQYEGQLYNFVLPESKQSPLIQTIMNKNRLFYKILSADSSVENGKLYLYHSHVGVLDLPFTKGEMGIVDLKGMADGNFTFLLTDNTGKVISQTTRWHETKKHKRDVSQWKSLYNPNERLDLSTHFFGNDSTSSLWVRVLPEDKILNIPQAETALLLENDFTSSVPVPVRYATSNEKDRETDWRGWLFSARLVRFDVASLVKDGFNYRYKPETAMVMSGQIQGNPGNYPLENGTVTIVNQLQGGAWQSELDENGRFTIVVDDFHDKSTFFVQGRDKKGVDGEYNYTFNSDTLPGISNHKKVQLDQELMVEYGMVTDKFSFDGNNLMPEVIVKGRIQVEAPESTERFYGVRFIGKEALRKRNYQSFEQMLSYFHAFIRTVRKGNPDAGDNKAGQHRGPGGSGVFESSNPNPFEPLIIFSRRPSTLDGTKPLPVYVDGSQWTAEEANQMLDMNQVDYVELLTPIKAQQIVPGAVDGALIIRTKKWEKETIISKGIHYTPPLGIANLDLERNKERVYKAPETPGRYRIFIDIIGEDKSVQSYMIPIEVL